MLYGMFPSMAVEDVWAAVRNLCYTVHGGSGYTFTRADVLAMGLGEMAEAIEWLDEQRRREAQALERASRKR